MSIITPLLVLVNPVAALLDFMAAAIIINAGFQSAERTVSRSVSVFVTIIIAYTLAIDYSTTVLNAFVEGDVSDPRQYEIAKVLVFVLSYFVLFYVSIPFRMTNLGASPSVFLVYLRSLVGLISAFIVVICIAALLPKEIVERNDLEYSWLFFFGEGIVQELSSYVSNTIAQIVALVMSPEQ